MEPTNPLAQGLCPVSVSCRGCMWCVVGPLFSCCPHTGNMTWLLSVLSIANMVCGWDCVCICSLISSPPHPPLSLWLDSIPRGCSCAISGNHPYWSHSCSFFIEPAYLHLLQGVCMCVCRLRCCLWVPVTSSCQKTRGLPPLPRANRKTRMYTSKAKLGMPAQVCCPNMVFR